MPGRLSIQSRTLANVRLQLKTGKTRGSNPRPLLPEEISALEARRDDLQAEMANRQRQRILSRVNIHTSQAVERTRDVIIAELQPLTSLVKGDITDSREERIKSRSNQIALLQAANREDQEAIRKERVATREASARAKANARSEKRRRIGSATESTHAPSTPTHWSGSDLVFSDEEEQEQNTANKTEAAVNMSVAEKRAELEVYLNIGVQAKVDQLMADIDARHGRK